MESQLMLVDVFSDPCEQGLAEIKNQIKEYQSVNVGGTMLQCPPINVSMSDNKCKADSVDVSWAGLPPNQYAVCSSTVVAKCTWPVGKWSTKLSSSAL